MPFAVLRALVGAARREDLARVGSLDLLAEVAEVVPTFVADRGPDGR
jgi:hypothetical protein